MKKLKLEYSKVGEDKEWASSCELMHISCFGFSFFHFWLSALVFLFLGVISVRKFKSHGLV